MLGGCPMQHYSYKVTFMVVPLGALSDCATFPVTVPLLFTFRIRIHVPPALHKRVRTFIYRSTVSFTVGLHESARDTLRLPSQKKMRRIPI